LNYASISIVFDDGFAEIINIKIKIICSEEALYLILESERLALSWRIEVHIP
jgi:hypothetical protein